MTQPGTVPRLASAGPAAPAAPVAREPSARVARVARLAPMAPVAGRLAVGLFALLAAALAVTLAGCSRSEPLARRTAPAARIVSLAPSVTEALFAIGAGAQVVGRSRFCDYPPEARSLPVVGDVEPDLEAILELGADLVVGIQGLSSARLVDRLDARRVANWFPGTSSLASIDILLAGLGDRAGHPEEARRVVAGLDARVKAIAEAAGRGPRPGVLLVVGLAPVIVAGSGSFADDLLAAAGGRNVAHEGGAWPTLGLERVADLDPDLLLDATDVGGSGASRIAPDAAGWSGVRAVREGRVRSLRDERVLRAGPRIAEGLEVLARLIHPELVLETDRAGRCAASVIRPTPEVVPREFAGAALPNAADAMSTALH